MLNTLSSVLFESDVRIGDTQYSTCCKYIQLVVENKLIALCMKLLERALAT